MRFQKKNGLLLLLSDLDLVFFTPFLSLFLPLLSPCFCTRSLWMNTLAMHIHEDYVTNYLTHVSEEHRGSFWLRTFSLYTIKATHSLQCRYTKLGLFAESLGWRYMSWEDCTYVVLFSSYFAISFWGCAAGVSHFMSLWVTTWYSEIARLPI